MSKLSLDDLFERFENIYEAVEVMALRARQVIDEQKREIDVKLSVQSETENDSDELGAIEIDREAFKQDIKVMTKPTVVAINEAVNDDLEFRYISPDDDAEDKSKKEEK
ncbi:DNA-directed RNA polymerase subunit omega [bacterium]|nr:DNA-directed RNA polymerase subunit omega [bacterium]